MKYDILLFTTQYQGCLPDSIVLHKIDVSLLAHLTLLALSIDQLSHKLFMNLS